MDFSQLQAFLLPALRALLPRVLPLIPAGSGLYPLAQTILKLLPAFGVAPGTPAPDVDLPPESEWTPEGILAHYESQCRGAVSDPDAAPLS